MNVIERGSRRFRERTEIEAAGYVPGWHGEPVEVDEQAVVFGQGQWREAIVTKVTDRYVHVVFTTPTAILEAQKLVTAALAVDPLRVRAEARKQALDNYDWDAYVAAGKPGDPWSPKRSSHIRLDERTIARAKESLASMPGREEYADGEADKAAESVRARARAASKGWEQWVHPVKGKGDRTGARTNLYVRPR